MLINEKGFWKTLTFIIIIISAIVTAFACYYLGVKSGLFYGAIAFFILGGLEVIWCAFNSPSKEEVEKKNHQEKLKFTEETRNNPTIR